MGSGSFMASSWIRGMAFPILVLALVSRTSGLAITYCSPDLTAGGPAIFKQFQTNNLCQEQCAGYAFAVLQFQNCWCSNYAPATTVSTYSCNTVCPGWPDDWCGSTTANLYGYYELDGKFLKGTAGASSATSGSSVSNTPSETGSSKLVPSTPSSSGGSSSLTMTPSVQSTTRTPSQTFARSSTTVPPVVPDSSTGSSSSSTITRSSVSEVYTSVTTVTGVVRTIVVTPTPTSDSTLGQGNAINSSGGGISTGTVVGIVVGVALGIGLIIGLGVWFWFRRRHQYSMEPISAADDSSAHGNTGIPSRQVSQMSSAGLLSKAPRIHTSGLPSIGGNPRSADTLGSNFDRRSVGTDQRLNPYAIYAHDESRHSNVSLQDNQDYSRQLRVANPDP